MRIMGKILIGILVGIGITTVLITVGLVYFVFQADGLTRQAKEAPEGIILALNFDAGLSEGQTGPNFSNFGLPQGPTLQDAIIALRRARDDDRVKAVVGTVNGDSLGLAQIQDMRDAIAYYQESGKPSYLYSETFGELTNATSAYYLASAFGEIWLQPSGAVGLMGISVEQPYLKEFLDRFGIQASFIRRYEYKTAAEQLTNSEMSGPSREALDDLLESIFGQIVSGIGQSRSLSEEKIRQLVNTAPLLARDALESGLIDQLAYKDEFDQRIEDEYEDAEMVTVGQYLRYSLPGGPRDSDHAVAIINAVGPIHRGTSEDGPFSTASTVGSKTLASAIRSAAEDDDIDAILLRVDSPGGSYVASDTVWREVVRARETEKPFVVSMGNTAASGGYFIAMAADTIYAQPSTVTGSIGVISGKLVFEEAFENLEINWETLSYGNNSGLSTSTRGLNESERALLNRFMDFIYDDFTTKAAQGRGMPLEELQNAARGRVWSGKDAHQLGLIDKLGGFSDAIDHTKVAIGLTPDDLVILVPYPPPQDPLDALFEALEEGSLPFGIRESFRLFASFAKFFNTWFVPVLKEPGANILYSEPLAIR